MSAAAEKAAIQAIMDVATDLKPTILVVEDDRPLQDALVTTLETAGYNVLAASDGGEAIKILSNASVDLVVSDVQMQPVDGRELLRKLRQRQPAPPVLLMTAYGTIEQAVAAMREGAVDYLVKPFEAEELERSVLRYVRPAGVRSGAQPVAEDPRSRELLDLAARVAQSDVTVLLTGESGTGKEVYARYIHTSSKRHTGPFVAVNCAAIPDQMLEAILFGHEKGAFTGAQARSPGKFVQANGGTILLDEVTEMDLSLQAKLLRVLQEREVEPLGASKPLPLDVRVLATSNRDLDETVRAGDFREDLYYRLSVFPLEIPPLRDRPGDIVALANRFVESRAGGTRTLSAAALARLTAYGWPGNVRQLENVMQRALVLSDGTATIEPAHLALDEHTRPPAAPASTHTLSTANGTAAALAAAPAGLAGEMWEEETRRIVTALQSTRGGRKQAAEQLGISDRTLRYKLSKMRAAGIQVPGDRI
jgi:two-component system response regulator FlrC